MISQELQDELSVIMIRASLQGKYGLHEVADKNGITLMQALTLSLLEPGQQLPMSALTTFLSCDPSNVTGIVERLVAGGFIERKESTEDRRIKKINLTEKGLSLRRTLLRIAAEKRLPNLSGLTQAEVSELIRLIGKATGSVTGDSTKA